MIRFLQRPSTAKKIVFAGILGVICFALVVTLVPGGTLMDFLGVGEAASGVVARVGRQDVTALEVHQMATQMGRRQFPRGAPPGVMGFFMEQAAQQLILQKAMMAEATRLGFTVTDEEVRRELQSGLLGAQLFPGGQFIGQEGYQNFVFQNFNMTLPQFESLVKNDLLIGKLRATIEGSVTVSENELEQEFRRRNTSVRFRYAVLPLESVMKDVRVTEEELRAFYDNNRERYRDAIPETRRLRFVHLTRQQAEKEAQVTREDLQRYYDEHREAYRVPEQAEVRHILVRTPPAPIAPEDTDQAAHQKAVAEHEQAVAAARTKAEDILRQVRAGASFEQLARKHSDDPGSAEEGGLLGTIERGQTVPEFERAAFTLEPGEVSDLVQTSFGFHIIRVENRETARIRPLEEVQERIEPAVRAEKVERFLDDRARILETQARATGLEDTAKRNNLELLTTDFVERTASLPRLGQAPDLMEAAFLAREGAAPDAIRVRDGYAIFEVPEVRSARTPEFEEIRARLEQEFRSQRANELLAQRTEELSDRARAAADLRRPARDLGAEVKTSEWVTLEGSVPDLGPMAGAASVAFGMKPGEISPALPANRNGAVLQVLERRDADMEQFKARHDEIRNELLEQKRNQILEVYLSELRRRMEQDGTLRINQQEMERLTARAGV
jgi:peptidyl-prolyl cis-trans isomerase D